MKKEREKLVKRIENEINKTPTGELRNLLCDVNITIQTLNSTLCPKCGSNQIYEEDAQINTCDSCCYVWKK